MTDKPKPDAEQAMRDWWRTSIIEMRPGVIRYRGYPIEEPRIHWRVTIMQEATGAQRAA